MIKVDDGKVVLEGTGLELLAEIGSILNVLREQMIETGYAPDQVKRRLYGLVDVACMPDDERKKRAEESRNT